MKRALAFLLIFTLFSILSIDVSASEIGEKEEIRNLNTKDSKINWKALKQPEIKTKPSLRRMTFEKGNLPQFLVRRGSLSQGSEAKPIKYPELHGLNRSGMKVGDIFDCIIAQDIVGYVGAISPVRATVLSGPFKGAMFVGNATLDPNTKNILVEFNVLRGAELTHKLKATVHSVTGELGLEGTHHSHYWKYFLATVLGRTAEGYADTLVQRQRNIFGNYQEVPSKENAGKTAVAEAASSTADLLTEKMRSLPEYTVVKGPIRTKIFITDTPKLTN